MIVYKPKRWALDVTVQPAIEPVTLAEVKAQARITHEFEDALLLDLAKTARATVEGATRRALLTQTRVLRLPGFPTSDDAVIELPGGKIQSITSIAYTDAAEQPQTWDSAEYVAELATTGTTGRVALAYGSTWPTTLNHGLPVLITYVAGWPAATDVPPALKTAVLMMATALNEQRTGMTTAAEDQRKSATFEALVARWRLPLIG